MVSAKHEAKPVAEINIPHATSTFVEKDPPREILHVNTDLVETPGAPGFDAGAAHDLRRAVANLVGGRDGFDDYKIHWKT